MHACSVGLRKCTSASIVLARPDYQRSSVLNLKSVYFGSIKAHLKIHRVLS